MLALFPALAGAQSLKGDVTGRVLTREGRLPIAGAEVTIDAGRPMKVYTDEDGVFRFERLEAGVYNVRISAPDWNEVNMNLRMKPYEDEEDNYKFKMNDRDMGIITLTPNLEGVKGVEDFDIMEWDVEEMNTEQGMNPILYQNDVFMSTAGYNFGSMRFRPRGYDQSMQGVYLNGIYFNDAFTGYSPWSLWSGLNDATRNQEITIGSQVSTIGVGGIAGTTNILTRASMVRKGFRASVVNASGQYRFRGMVTYGSGQLDNGWSYALSVSTRQGGNDWVKGVYYNSWGYFASVEKKFGYGWKHSLALTALGTPGERAAQGASTEEVYDLVNSNYYNPNWGYQGGRDAMDRRSARVRDVHEPIVMLNYSFKPNEKTEFTAAFSYRFGFNGYSALDWGDAPDPRPDYYRNLPSYSMREGEYYNPDKALADAEGWRTDWRVRQIDWQKMYNINRGNKFRNEDTEYYNGMNPEGLSRSLYVLEDRRNDQRDMNAALKLKTQITDRSNITFGYNLRINRTESYKKIKDLLGGDYYLDVDKYAETGSLGLGVDATQNNTATPNRLVKKGDKYGYDYYSHLRNQNVWAIYQLKLPHWVITLAGESGNTRMWREGRWQKALFMDNSKGNSEKLDFWEYKAKAAVTWRIDGASTIEANFARIQAAPYFQNAFVSPRTRNTVAPNVTTEKITSVDLSYMLNLRKVRGRITGFYTRIDDRMDMISFYNDAGSADNLNVGRTFTNYSLSGIDQVYTGFEFGITVPISPSFSADGVFSYGYYKYASNPLVTQTQDNTEAIIMKDVPVYWKDMKVEGTPQTAASISLNYRGPGSIFAGVNLNFYDAMYLGMNPVRRTDIAHYNYDLTNKDDLRAFDRLTSQEMFHYAFVLNANVGKMWRIGEDYTLGLNLQINNILNDKDIRTGGYEQMRLQRDQQSDGSTKYSAFDSKYYYMFGTTYYLQLYLRF